jgi:hypothetical protein
MLERHFTPTRCCATGIDCPWTTRRRGGTSSFLLSWIGVCVVGRRRRVVYHTGTVLVSTYIPVLVLVPGIDRTRYLVPVPGTVTVRHRYAWGRYVRSVRYWYETDKPAPEIFETRNATSYDRAKRHGQNDQEKSHRSS